MMKTGNCPHENAGTAHIDRFCSFRKPEQTFSPDFAPSGNRNKQIRPNFAPSGNRNNHFRPILLLPETGTGFFDRIGSFRKPEQAGQPFFIIYLNLDYIYLKK
jgi:hypothetical protein